MLYRCIATDGEQDETVSDFDAVDDADALMKSEILLADRDYTSLEVWRENRIVGYRSHADQIATNAHELWIFVTCLVGVVSLCAVTIAVVLGVL